MVKTTGCSSGVSGFHSQHSYASSGCSNPGGSNAFLWPLRATGRHMVHRHACGQNTNTPWIKIKKSTNIWISCALLYKDSRMKIRKQYIWKISHFCFYRPTPIIWEKDDVERYRSLEMKMWGNRWLPLLWRNEMFSNVGNPHEQVYTVQKHISHNISTIYSYFETVFQSFWEGRETSGEGRMTRKVSPQTVLARGKQQEQFAWKFEDKEFGSPASTETLE